MSKVIFGKYELETLVALTDYEQNRGLMGAAWPPPVMSFPKSTPTVCKYWMKNTPSPLDIIFCRSGHVIQVEKGTPNSENHVGPDEESDLVVELPFGTASRLSIASGTPVRLVYDLQAMARKVELWLAKNG